MRTNIEATSTFGPSKCSKRICDSSDGMSLLPDEILVSILSCLTIKEAARTSVLSSRWRFLWTFYNGKMVFVSEEWKIKRSLFVGLLNQILKLHRGASVERLKINADDYSGEDFHNWIEFAARKRVKSFELVLRPLKSYIHEWAYSSITRQFLSRFCFKSLRVLRIKFINVNDEAIEYFLINCPKLHRLDLHHSTGLSNLLIPHSSLGLKYLSVAHCQNLKRIELSARNLKVFDYFGPEINVEVKEDLNLRIIYYGGACQASLSDAITKLGRGLPLLQLERLSLDFYCRLEHYQLPDIKHFTLPKLKRLNLHFFPTFTGDNMLNCISMLEAAPILHTFTVTFSWSYNNNEELPIFDVSRVHWNRVQRHQCLEVVKIRNYGGAGEAVTKFVKALIMNLVSLKKLVIGIDPDGEKVIKRIFYYGYLRARMKLVIKRSRYIFRPRYILKY